jgi:hypothetical protein
VVDGTGWSLLLVHDEFRVESDGSNAYPERNGRERELSTTDAFEALLAALHALVVTTIL